MITKLKCIYHILKGDGVVYRFNPILKGDIDLNPNQPAKCLYIYETDFCGIDDDGNRETIVSTL